MPPDFYRNFHPSDGSCLAKSSCPFEGASVPRCASDASDDLERVATGKSARLRGTLSVMPFGRTTLAMCGEEHPCCNRYSVQMVLVAGGHEIALTESGKLGEKDAFTCIGDMSAVCCGFAAIGDEVIIQGTMRETSSYGGNEDPPVNHPLSAFELEGFCRTSKTAALGTNLGRLPAGRP